MFALNKLVLFTLLAFAVMVHSVPLHHSQHGPAHRMHRTIKRRSSSEGSCRHRSSSSTVAAPTAVSSQAAEPTSTEKHSSSSSSAAPTPTETADDNDGEDSGDNNNDDDSGDDEENDGNVFTGLLNNLFPAGASERSWSTADGAKKFVSLSDDTLKIFSNMNSLSHDYVHEHGKNAVKAKYAKGSYVLSKDPKGGFSFYAKGPDDVDLKTAKEVTFGYSAYFPEDFDFVKGGKMPGVYGGDSDEGSLSCSGGSRNDECFSVRLMWRKDGMGEFYTYLPPSYDANKRVCDVAPQSECNSDYGASVGRGSFTFERGAWTTITMRVKLNDKNQDNGEIELFANGKSVVSVDGLRIRDSGAGLFRGLMMQTFFGGGDTSFSTPKYQEVLFADLSLDITKTF